MKIDKTPTKPVSNEKIVEKKADDEEGTVSNKIDTATVKVRRGPSTGYRTIAEVPKGSALEILGKHDGWYKVRVNGKEGFIYGGYVNCKPMMPTPPPLCVEISRLKMTAIAQLVMPEPENA